MNRRQKTLLRDSIFITVLTLVAMIVFLNLRDGLNKREALLAMEQLGRQIQAYRQEHGSVPAREVVDQMLETIPGQARLRRLAYRAHWLGLNSHDETLLAYTHKRFHGRIVASGYVVLYLNGKTQWLPPLPFETLLASQQTPEEREAPRKR